MILRKMHLVLLIVDCFDLASTFDEENVFSGRGFACFILIEKSHDWIDNLMNRKEKNDNHISLPTIHSTTVQRQFRKSLHLFSAESRGFTVFAV